MKCPGCGAQEATTMFPDKGFGTHTCPQWSMCIKQSEVCVCVCCFRKQEGNEVLFYMNSAVLAKPALPISCRLPQGRGSGSA